LGYGFGILTKYKIKNTELIILPPVKKDKKFGFLHAVIKTTEGDIDLINVHFENTNEGSKEHLRQTLEWCEKNGIKPIIAGDFNMKMTETLIELADKDYEISYKIKNYKSFLPTEFSHDKEPLTLDYIIAHRGKFKMSKVDCVDNDISDHKPVIAELDLT